MILKKILLLFLFFTLIFKPEFIFIPHSVNMFFGLLGVFAWYYNKSQRLTIVKNSLIDGKTLLKTSIPFILASFVSMVLNMSTDTYYPRYAMSLVLGYFSFYLVAVLFYKIYGKMCVDKVIDYFVVSECVFLLIGVLSFFSPSLYDMLNGLQKYNDISMEAMDRTEGSRLISIGAQFFSAAIINGFVLIIIGFRLLYNHDSVLRKSLYILAFIFITVVGMMMGRTTIFGALIGIILISASFISNRKNSYKTITSLAIIVTLVLYVVKNYNYSSNQDIDTLSSFGFEMFINYQNGEGFSAKSNNSLFEMWNSIPTDVKTWVIGDGLWSEGDHYYKRVDAGYLRGLWYFGMVGLVCLFSYYYKVIKYVAIKKRVFFSHGKIPMLCLLVYVIILNYKGPVDLFFLLLPFVFCNVDFYKKNA